MTHGHESLSISTEQSKSQQTVTALTDRDDSVNGMDTYLRETWTLQLQEFLLERNYSACKKMLCSHDGRAIYLVEMG